MGFERISNKSADDSKNENGEKSVNKEETFLRIANQGEYGFEVDFEKNRLKEQKGQIEYSILHDIPFQFHKAGVEIDEEYLKNDLENIMYSFDEGLSEDDIIEVAHAFLHPYVYKLPENNRERFLLELDHINYFIKEIKFQMGMIANAEAGRPIQGTTEEEKEKFRIHTGGMTKEQMKESKERISKMEMK